MELTYPDNGLAVGTSPGEDFTWKPLRFFTAYRMVLAILLAGLFFLAPTRPAVGPQAPGIFGAAALLYVLVSVVFVLAGRTRWPAYNLQVSAQVITDILIITMLMYASGSLESGLGILLGVTVAAGGLLMPGRSAFLFAALATLAVLGEQSYTLLTRTMDLGDYTHAGLFGAAFFATATLAHMLALRVRESEALAKKRGVDLANLETLNAYIIQHLQSGVLAVDAKGRVRLVNEPAWRLLGLPGNPGMRSLTTLSRALTERLEQWRRHPGREPAPFQPPGSAATVLPRFTPLGTTEGSGTLIFLEDSAALAQRAQQMKLASLGRLTASIAHEIRNPLGAISHASQLLGEAPGLTTGDRRLVDIICEQSGRVNIIVENVLQLSRREPSHPQTLALQDWLDQFVHEFVQYERVPAEQIATRTEPPDTRISFDPTHLHQVLWNLCKNAVEHGGHGDRPPRVELRAAADTGRGETVLEVIDNGPGIDADTEQQIFEPFYTTAAGGTGLGLYIARELCECNRAALSYRRMSGGGSCFRITFSDNPGQEG
ncbi:MAG TPA: ATP-binding protein [Gammaproteobacteria bacterium]|nr:ATP-binding protein [Gammaproteobacteria bacterium]